MARKSLIHIIFILLSACSVKPTPLSLNERYQIAQSDIKQLMQPQASICRKVNYYEVLARSIKYNLDYRIKLANTALQAGQLDVAEFTMFPQLNFSGSIYTRSNNYASFGVTPNGQTTDVLIGTPRTLRSARLAATWNLLDFGLSYVKTRQQGNKLLIAQEEAHKQEQVLAQNVLVAYWEAYNAQQLLRETKEFQKLLTQAKMKLTMALRDPIIPKEDILEYQQAVLEGDRRISQLDFKYHKAMIDLAHMMSLPPDIKLVLAPPPYSLTTLQKIKKLDFQKMDAISLAMRPELRGQEYQRRIAELGVSTAILQALPGFTLNDGWNYNSNKFLVNNKWMDRSIDAAWNLMNLASLPSAYSAAKYQVNYERFKRIALTFGVLTETRYAYWHFRTLTDEYLLVHQQTINAREMYKLNRNRKMASLTSSQKVILSKLHLITTEMDEQLVLADLSTALGELYLSVGADLLPLDVDNESVDVLTNRIKELFLFAKANDFTQYVNTTYDNLFSPINSSKYTIQVLGSNRLSDVESKKKQLKTNLPCHIAQIDRKGQIWYILAIGEFDKLNQAKKEFTVLSQNQSTAWIRKTEGLKWLS